MCDVDKRLEWTPFSHDDYLRELSTCIQELYTPIAVRVMFNVFGAQAQSQHPFRPELLHQSQHPFRPELLSLNMTAPVEVCDQQEVTVTSSAQKKIIAAQLECSLEHRGRALRSDLDAFRLKKGDRLIPTNGLPDTHAFEAASVPFVVTFFRCGKRSRLTNASPLYKIPGLTSDLLAIDLLHSWHLGGCAEFVGEALWFVVHSGLYTQGHNAPAADCEQVALLKLKADLWSYYSRRSLSDPDFKSSGSRVDLQCTVN
jgi:hypothetical protein